MQFVAVLIKNHPDQGFKLAEGGNQKQASLWVRRFYRKLASEQSGAFFIPKIRKE